MNTLVEVVVHPDDDLQNDANSKKSFVRVWCVQAYNTFKQMERFSEAKEEEEETVQIDNTKRWRQGPCKAKVLST